LADLNGLLRRPLAHRMLQMICQLPLGQAGVAVELPRLVDLNGEALASILHHRATGIGHVARKVPYLLC